MTPGCSHPFLFLQFDPSRKGPFFGGSTPCVGSPSRPRRTPDHRRGGRPGTGWKVGVKDRRKTGVGDTWWCCLRVRTFRVHRTRSSPYTDDIRRETLRKESGGDLRSSWQFSVFGGDDYASTGVRRKQMRGKSRRERRPRYSGVG